MGLEYAEYAVVPHFARGGESCGDLGRMMCVIAEHVGSRGGRAALFHAPGRAREAFESVLYIVDADTVHMSRGERGKRIVDEVRARNGERDLAEAVSAERYGEARAAAVEGDIRRAVIRLGAVRAEGDRIALESCDGAHDVRIGGRICRRRSRSAPWT